MRSSLAIVLALVILIPVQTHASGILFARVFRSTLAYQSMVIKNYDATVDIQDHIATTHIDQTFTNTINGIVEATFIFPLPDGAMITDMAYWFNGVRYVASVREKKEAQAAYDANLRKYMDPALLQEIGENTFKLNIAPINPNTDVRVEITYTEILPYQSGTLTYTHLLRTTGASAQPLQRASIRVNAQTQAAWTSCTTPGFDNSPANSIERAGDQRYTVSFGDENVIATRDYRVVLGQRHAALETNVLTYVPMPRDSFGTDGFFATWMIPPDNESALLRRDIVFVADVSSSMEGQRIEQLKSALQSFLDGLHDDDAFNIITFSTNVRMFSPDVVPATQENVERAREYVRRLTALGLTNISAALDAAVRSTFTEGSANVIIFLTDGIPSWGVLTEGAIVDSVNKHNTSHARIYPIGVGDEPSKSFLKNIATSNGGFATFITGDDSISVVVADHLHRISMPFMTKLALAYGELAPTDVLPADLPDATVGSRVLQFGRFHNASWQPVTLTGLVQNVPFTHTKNVFFGDTTRNNRAVARLWARFKIDALLEEISVVGERKELVDAVIDLSIRFGILTKYTALYADPNDPKTDVPIEPGERPIESSAITIAPNPVTDVAAIDMRLPLRTHQQHLTVSVVDALGRVVAILFEGMSTGGDITLTLSLADDRLAALPSGMFYLAVSMGDQVTTVPFSIIR